MKRETNELAWRTKLIVGLALLGGLIGGLLYLHFFIFESELQVLPRYGIAVWNSFTLDAPGALLARREILYSAAAGAAALAGPVLLFLVKPRGSHNF